MVRRLLPLSSVVVVAASAAACGAPPDDGASGSQDVTAASALFGDETSMFQDDRVGRALKDSLANVPQDYPSFEKLFKMGRACARPDGKKEIFIVEEAQSRPVEGGVQSKTKSSKLMPRAVITGCNTGDTSQSATVKSSYSLMTALISDEGEPNAASGDTMSMTPLEVMAFDDKTGLYNFYVFEPTAAGKPGTVTRFWRNKDGKVFRRKLVGGTVAPTDITPHEHDACFRCHVNGAPLMNELSEPWTNWISPKKKLPTSTMSGTTKELVDQASLADLLESIIRAGTQDYVNGLHAQDGWLNRTRDGKLPGGTSKLLEPIFCETELNYLSADTTNGIPLQVFFDPSVTLSAGLALPDAPAGGNAPVPFLFPIRAVRDEVTERSLVKRDYLTDGMAVAIRLIDDENDVFSTKRCGVFTDLKAAIVKAEAGEVDKALEPKDVKTIVRQVIESKLPTLGIQPARLEYLKARLAGTVQQQKQVAYNAELNTRFAALDKDIGKREAARKDAARKMFPNPANPMPILDPAK
jgi:hypothetical protein